MKIAFPTTTIAEERQEQYKDADFLTGVILSIVDIRLLQTTTLLYHWTMCLGKLLRATASPLNDDHWNDLIGYANRALLVIATVASSDDSKGLGKE